MAAATRKTETALAAGADPESVTREGASNFVPVVEAPDGFTVEQIVKLQEKLDPKLVAVLDKGKSGKFKYLETHAAIAQANRIFGFDGWGYRLTGRGVITTGETPDKLGAVHWATVEVFVSGKAFNAEDIGTCELRNSVWEGKVRDNVNNPDSISTAMKGAVSDALKRALRSLGEQFGNGLYDVDGNVYGIMQQLEASSNEMAGSAPSSNGSSEGKGFGDKISASLDRAELIAQYRQRIEQATDGAAMARIGAAIKDDVERGKIVGQDRLDLQSTFTARRRDLGL